MIFDKIFQHKSLSKILCIKIKSPIVHSFSINGIDGIDGIDDTKNITKICLTLLKNNRKFEFENLNYNNISFNPFIILS